MNSRFLIGVLGGAIGGIIVGWLASSFREPNGGPDEPKSSGASFDVLSEKLDQLQRQLATQSAATPSLGQELAAAPSVPDVDNRGELRTLLLRLDAKLDLVRGGAFEGLPESLRTPKRVAEVDALVESLLLDEEAVRTEMFGMSFAAVLALYGIPDNVYRSEATSWEYLTPGREFRCLSILFCDGLVCKVSVGG